MSSTADAARALNRLASSGYDFLGESDGPALQSFLQDYFCGEGEEEELPESGFLINLCMQWL